MLSKLPPIERYEPEPAPVVKAEDFSDHSVVINKVDGIYTVEAKWLYNVMRSINFDDYESFNYFQNVLTKNGVFELYARLELTRAIQFRSMMLSLIMWSNI